MMYYREVVRLALAHAPDARSVIDVGSMNSPFILRFDWIPEKASLDLYKQGRLRRVKNIKVDFLTWQPDRVYELVLCLQVLEHLDEPAPFARKLLACGRRVIVSVPYCWPPGHEPSHVQDPVDEAKVAAWLGRPWIEHLIAREADDPFARLIVVVDGTAIRPRPCRSPPQRAASDERARPLSARLLRGSAAVAARGWRGSGVGVPRGSETTMASHVLGVGKVERSSLAPCSTTMTSKHMLPTLCDSAERQSATRLVDASRGRQRWRRDRRQVRRSPPENLPA
jgi:hypothetical protein